MNNFFLAMPHNKEFTIIGTGICISERGQHGHEGKGYMCWTVGTRP